MASVETTTTNLGMTVSAIGHPVSDVRDEANLEIIDGVLEDLSNSATTGTSLSFSSVGTTDSIGIEFVDAYLGKAIETGTYQSTASGGITINGANNRPVSFLCDDAGVALAAADHRFVVARTLLTIDQTNTFTLNSIRGQIKLLDGIDISAASVMAPVQGYLELAGTGARTLTGHNACVRAALEEGASGTTTIAASSYHCGFEATLTSTRSYTVTGEMAGLAVNISGGTSVWDTGVLIDGGAATTGIKIGAATTHLNLTGAVTNVIDFTGASTGVTEDNLAAPDKAGSIAILTPAGAVAYINYYDGTRA